MNGTKVLKDSRFVIGSDGLLIKNDDAEIFSAEDGYLKMENGLIVPEVSQIVRVGSNGIKEEAKSSSNILTPEEEEFEVKNKKQKIDLPNGQGVVAKKKDPALGSGEIRRSGRKTKSESKICRKCLERFEPGVPCGCVSVTVDKGTERKAKKMREKFCVKCGKSKTGDLDVCRCKAKIKKTKKVKKEAVVYEPEWPIYVPEAQPDDMIHAKFLEGHEMIIHSSHGSNTAKLLNKMELCVICGSFEEDMYMISCFNCAQTFHRSCLMMKADPIIETWRCPSCKGCEVCQSSGHEDMLLVCEKCDCAYHTYCLDPPLGFIPSGDWFCPQHANCISCGSKSAGTQPQHMWHDNDTLCHVCWVRIRDKNQCPTCLRAYDPNDWDCSFMVGCDCGRWVHRGCDGITAELYEELQKPSRSTDVYNCIVCRESYNKVQFENEELARMVKHEEAAPTSLLLADEPAVAPAILLAEDPSTQQNVYLQRKDPIQLERKDDVLLPEVLLEFKCSFCLHGPDARKLGRLLPMCKQVDCWAHLTCILWFFLLL